MKTNRLTFLIITVITWMIVLQGILFSQSVPVSDLFDGTVSDGNPSFYFLPPMVSEPQFNGTFDNSLEPTIEICEVVNGLCQFPPVGEFPFGGRDGVKLTDDLDEIHYKLNWTPSDYNLDPYGLYQIRVLVGGLLMGFVTVSGDLGNETIPVQFRLEEGCTDWGAVGPEGGIIEFTNGVVFDIPANAVSSYVAIGIFPLPTEQAQAILDARPYRSSDKTVLGGFKAEPDGLNFDVPITVRLSILPTDKLPLQVEMSLDPPKYWITPTELIYDPLTNIAEFPLNHFSEHAVIEVVGGDIELPNGCSEGKIHVVVQAGDFAGGNGCQIVGESVEVTFHDCPGQPKQSVYISETTPECGDEFHLTIDVQSPTVKVCRSMQIQATVTDQDGRQWGIPLRWSSLKTAVARIHQNSGVVTGMSEGDAKIVAKTFDPRFFGEEIVFVDPPPPIIIWPPGPITLNKDDVETLEATDETGQPYSCDGLPGSQQVNWTSSDPEKVEVNPVTGVVLGKLPGVATVTATLGSATGTKTVTVVGSEECDADNDGKLDDDMLLSGIMCCCFSTGYPGGYDWGVCPAGEGEIFIGQVCKTGEIRSVIVPTGTYLTWDLLDWSDGTLPKRGDDGIDIDSLLSTLPVINEYALHQNYPNPFNPTTTISYQVPEASNVNLKVYDVLSREVAILVNEKKPAGYYEVEFSATGGATALPSGIYFYRLQAGSFIETKKMVLMK